MENKGIYSDSGKHEPIKCSTCGNYYKGGHYCSGKGPNTPKPFYEQLEDSKQCIIILLDELTKVKEELTKVKAELAEANDIISDFHNLTVGAFDKTTNENPYEYMIKKVRAYNNKRIKPVGG